MNVNGIYMNPFLCESNASVMSFVEYSNSAVYEGNRSKPVTYLYNSFICIYDFNINHNYLYITNYAQFVVLGGISCFMTNMLATLVIFVMTSLTRIAGCVHLTMYIRVFLFQGYTGVLF